MWLYCLLNVDYWVWKHQIAVQRLCRSEQSVLFPHAAQWSYSRHICQSFSQMLIWLNDCAQCFFLLKHLSLNIFQICWSHSVKVNITVCAQVFLIQWPHSTHRCTHLRIWAVIRVTSCQDSWRFFLQLFIFLQNINQRHRLLLRHVQSLQLKHRTVCDRHFCSLTPLVLTPLVLSLLVLSLLTDSTGSVSTHWLYWFWLHWFCLYSLWLHWFCLQWFCLYSLWLYWFCVCVFISCGLFDFLSTCDVANSATLSLYLSSVCTCRMQSGRSDQLNDRETVWGPSSVSVS